MNPATTTTTDAPAAPRCERAACGVVIEHRAKDGRNRIASRRFCSRACYEAHWRETYPTKPCPVCGRDFGPSRSEARATFDQRKTCSKQCAGRSRRDGGTPLPPTRKCERPGCTVTFERKPYEGPQRWTARRFCSPGCSSTGRRRRAPAKRVTRPRPQPSPQRTTVPAVERPPWRPAGFTASPDTRPAGAR